MRKVILYIATSQDGFIARPDGDTAWLHGPGIELPGEDFGYGALMDRIDTTLMGRKTLEVIDGFDVPFPYADKTNFAYSRAPQPAHAQVEWVGEPPAAHVRHLRAKPGKDIWLIGGASLFADLADAGLVDELILTEVPVVLGEGIPLFLRAEDRQAWEIQQVREYPNGVKQTFARWRL